MIRISFLINRLRSVRLYLYEIMKPVLTLLFCLSGLLSVAQQDTIDASLLQVGYTGIPVKSRLINPVFVIKGDDIRRFPGLSFLEAVDGLFPWVCSFESNANDFLYIIDGNVIVDVNAVSLYNIEDVTFIRGGVDAGNYPYTKRGTFIIHSKKTSTLSSFQFNITSGYQYLKNDSPFFAPQNALSTSSSASTKELLQNYQISYSGKTGKAVYFLSANYANDKSPSLSFQQFWFQGTSTYRYLQQNSLFRFYAGASVPILPSLQFDFMGIADVQHGTNNSTAVYSTYNGIATVNSSLPERYYTLHTSLNWKINNSFSNKLSLAYSNNKERLEMDSNSISNQPYIYKTSVTDTSTVKRGYLENNTVFESGTKTSLKLKAGFLLKYNFDVLNRSHLGITVLNNQYYSAEGNHYQNRMKMLTGTPFINLDYKNLLSYYGGLGLILYNAFDYGNFRLRNSNRILPYTGVVVSVMNLFSQKKIINRLDIGIHYSVRNTNLSDLYRLEKKETPYQFSVFSVYTLYSPYDFFKDKLLSVQATAGFSDDRFMIGAEWFKGKEEKYLIFYPLLPGSPSGITQGNVETKGLCIFGKAQLLKRNKYSWNMRLNAVKQERTNSNKYTFPEGYYPVTVGLQNNITIFDFFFQVSAAMGFDRELNPDNSSYTQPEKVNDISLRHVLFGYKLPITKKWINSMQVFVQAKNIITSRNPNFYNSFSRYFGTGLNIDL